MMSFKCDACSLDLGCAEPNSAQIQQFSCLGRLRTPSEYWFWSSRPLLFVDLGGRLSCDRREECLELCGVRLRRCSLNLSRTLLFVSPIYVLRVFFSSQSSQAISYTTFVVWHLPPSPLVHVAHLRPPPPGQGGGSSADRTRSFFMLCSFLHATWMEYATCYAKHATWMGSPDARMVACIFRVKPSSMNGSETKVLFSWRRRFWCGVLRWVSLTACAAEARTRRCGYPFKVNKSVITSLIIPPIPYLLQEVVKRDGTMVNMTKFPIGLVQ